MWALTTDPGTQGEAEGGEQSDFWLSVVNNPVNNAGILDKHCSRQICDRAVSNAITIIILLIIQQY